MTVLLNWHFFSSLLLLLTVVFFSIPFLFCVALVLSVLVVVAFVTVILGVHDVLMHGAYMVFVWTDST